MSDARNIDRAAADSAGTMRELLVQLTSRLEMSEPLAAAGENDALNREAREILSTLLGIMPGDVSRRVDEHVANDIARRALSVAMRRASGEPLAYCLGSAPFRNLELLVDRRVLIPRPETEIVVDQAL